MDKPIIIRDVRRKEHFIVDDEYLNGYAKLCGSNATLVYLCLCRHADFHTQECYPSVKTMSEKLGISQASVKRGIESLIEWNIVTKKRVRHPQTEKWANNSYTLVDKSDWKVKPQLSVSSGKPQLTNDKTHSSQGALKDTHNTKDTQLGADAPFVWEEYLKNMLVNPQRHIKIIGFYMKTRDKKFDTLDEVQTAIKRHAKAAKELVGFPNSKIGESIRKLAYEFPKFTLETVLKDLTK